MPLTGRLILDTVEGHNIIQNVYSGQISRMYKYIGYLPFGVISDPGMLTKALQHTDLPSPGEPYPDPNYTDWTLRTYRARATSAKVYSIEAIYEWLGVLRIKDSSSLTTISAQVHPKDKKPLYVTWTNPNDPNHRRIKKLLTLPHAIPLRHITASQTIDFTASASVLAAFRTVNDRPWKGLEKGFWLFSGLEGETLDNGITYTYSVTISTRQIMDWSQFGFLQDDRGNAIVIPEASVQALLNKPYIYDQDTSVDGINKVGMFDLSNFSTVFGF